MGVFYDIREHIIIKDTNQHMELADMFIYHSSRIRAKSHGQKFLKCFTIYSGYDKIFQSIILEGR